MIQSALAVDSDPAQLALTARALADLAYSVLTAATFEDASRQILATATLALLVSDIRLGEFNGIHLALRARVRHPKVLLIITQDAYDPTLEFEAKQIGAVYCLKPVTPARLAAIASPSHASDPPTADGARRWPRKHVAYRLPASVNDREVLVRDVSYGGLCVEFPQGHADSLPATIDMFLPTFGMSVKIHPVWTRVAAPSAKWVCGSEVIESDQQTLTLWHQFVDGCPV